MDAQTIVNLATPVVVPLIIAGIKYLKPNIPSFLLPVIAPILGGLLGVISSAALNYQGNLLVSVILGLAGIGVREVIDQVKPTPAETPKS